MDKIVVGLNVGTVVKVKEVVFEGQYKGVVTDLRVSALGTRIVTASVTGIPNGDKIITFSERSDGRLYEKGKHPESTKKTTLTYEIVGKEEK